MAPIKILTAAQMREVDRQTVELGIPGLILMENAAARAVEFLVSEFGPVAQQRIVVFCGKGNNGGDGLAIARQLLTRFRAASLDVLLACAPAELQGDAAANLRMFEAAGGTIQFEIRDSMRAATLIVDALLGTGLTGPARGKSLGWIHEINGGFPGARVLAVDVPSGMPSDTGDACGECARADATVTFTSPRYCHVMAPNAEHVGTLRIAPIGTPPALYRDDASIWLSLIGARSVAELLAPRKPSGNKGSYGHVLIVAGSRGKTGAAAMSGMAALRAGAGLSSVASAASAIPVIAGHAAELMTEALPETLDGAVAEGALPIILKLMEKLTILAIGPGLGENAETAKVVRDLFAHCDKPMVVDADALNILSQGDWPEFGDRLRILTPHPGEMARLTRSTVKEVQGDRLKCARDFATSRRVILVLKGQDTLLAFPDGRVWLNPTGSPSMATGGTGDVLTGMIAGMLAQFPKQPDLATAAAVYLHGLSGQLGAQEIGEQSFVATDLLRLLPRAIRESRESGTKLDDSDVL